MPTASTTTSAPNSIGRCRNGEQKVLSATANAPAHVLFYAEEAGAAADPALTNRWPVALAAVSFTSDGTDYTGVVPLGGLFAAETNP